MRKLLTFLACALLWLLCAPLCRAQPVLTTIQDTLYNLDGSLMNGSLIVTTPAFSVGGVPIAHGTHTFPITNGVVNIQLAPTDHANPAVTYTVDTVSNGLGAASVWSVPTLPSAQCASSSHCTIAEVTVASGVGPTLLLNPSQISTGASQSGQFLCNVVGIVGWCNAGGGIWGSITGTLSAQTDLENALNAKQSALGFTPENVANKDAIGGYAGLDSGGNLKVSTECPTASASQKGCLSAGDWAAFNGKVQSATVTLSAAQVSNLFTTSYPLVPAPGNGTVLQYLGHVVNCVSGATPTVLIAGFGEIGQVGYGAGAFTQNTITPATGGYLNTPNGPCAANALIVDMGTAGNYEFGNGLASAAVINQPLSFGAVCVSGSCALSSGTTTMTITTFYRMISGVQ